MGASFKVISCVAVGILVVAHATGIVLVLGGLGLLSWGVQRAVR